MCEEACQVEKSPPPPKYRRGVKVWTATSPPPLLWQKLRRLTVTSPPPACAAPLQAAAARALLKILPSFTKLALPRRTPMFLCAQRERQIFWKVPVQ